MRKYGVIFAAVALAVVSVLSMVGCQCKHEWSEATCKTPSVCALCNEIQGEPLGHAWSEATCEAPKICVRCDVTEGAVLEHEWTDATCTSGRICALCGADGGGMLPHDWIAATCTQPRTCAVCEVTEGELLEHQWADANCETPATCQACAQTKGEPLGHDYTRAILSRATCQTEGTEVFTCSRCSHRYSQKYKAPIYTAEELYQLTKDSVGELIIYSKSGDKIGLGTAFVYTKDGQIVTNYHVIEHAYSAVFAIGTKEYEVQRIIGYDEKLDLAILKIAATGLKPLPVCGASVATGAQVYALGSSRGMTSTFTSGIITTAEREMDGVVYVQHNAAISEGNSGGPLINAYGEVIAVNTMFFKNAQNLNFSVFASELTKVKIDKSLTLSEFYAIANDPVADLRELVMTRGEYSDDTYELLISLQFAPDLQSFSTAVLAYSPDEDLLALVIVDMSVNNTEQYDIYMLNLSEAGDSYLWAYMDATGASAVEGELKAAEFTPNTASLTSTERQGVSSYKVNLIEQRVAQLLHVHLGHWLDAAMQEYLGYGIESLGFTSYNKS